MTEANNFNSQHRPLVGSVAIMSSAGPSQRGTLTAVARRANGDKVLVTCLHNVSSESGDRWRVSGNEVIYQGGTLSPFPFYGNEPVSAVVGSALAYQSIVDGHKLTFKLDGKMVVDEQTKSTWNGLGL